MEHVFMWILWAAAAAVPFLGLGWCLTSPTAQVHRTHDVAETSPER